ncbi:hypothetical protein [Ruminococcus sp. RTP21484sp1_RTP31003st1_F6_RTP31003_210430]|uniref:DUF7507 domain-containing protein n=1 Tax=Ruminococcus sp. RTP21484sp1_RTP31003st1_F6_RTP31003_210430 TaxID=3141610 RepID=UPI0034A22E2C
MKNRIWKKILAVGVSLLVEAGMLVGCTAQPAVAYGAEMEGGLSVVQDAAWTDLQKFQAVISVKADGLASLTWENENQEYESGDENLFSSGNQDGSLENDQYDFSDETISHPTSYELVVWLSEYFQPDASFMAPEGCLKEELPIETADGRSSSITGFRWKINSGEQGKQLKIPVTLRDEYRFPAEKHTVPTCQDILHANGAISGEENGGGVYIVKKVENEKNILCKALSKSLEIPAAYMDFSVEMEAKEKALYTGKRIHMAVNLTNNGQVPFYKISLQAKVKEQELVPVWEKEPGLEVLESGAVLECLSAGETRTLSFYIDPDMNQKSNLELFAKTENPVSLEKAAEKQLTLQQGKASFTVKKTADCDNASPGETVTYQISIHNTGEVTLHSVVTTERFGLAGVTATFQEQRGITLNKSRTQAKIQEIAPGGCVNLKAKVVLPKDLKDQNLMNQIIVVTDETGEESAVRDQATIRVEDKEKDGNGSGNGNGGGNGDGTGIGSGNNDGSTMAASTSPKTGDTSHKELFQVLILLSFLFSAVAARRMFGGNAHR